MRPHAILQQVHTEALELPNISPSLMSPQGAAGTSYLKKMQKAMMKMEKAMATPQPAVATTIKACAMDLFRAGFCQTRTHCVRQALDQPRKPDCHYQSHGADNPGGLLQGPHTSHQAIGLSPQNVFRGSGAVVAQRRCSLGWGEG